MENSNIQSIAICEKTVFHISNGKSPLYLHNKYSVGRVDKKTLFLKPYEAIYLYLRNRIKPLNGMLKDEISVISALIQENDIHKLKVYLELKDEGTKIAIESDYFNVVRKNEKQSVRRKVVPVRENERISFQWLKEMAGANVASVDDDGDITYYTVHAANLQGKNSMDLWIVQENKDDYVMGIGNRGLGKKDKLPSWMGDALGDVTFLSEQEFSILTKRDSIDPVTQIYGDLIKRGMIVKTGFKYGCTFRAYEESLEDHSEYLIHITENIMEWYEISRAVRVAAAVRKRMVFSSIIDKEPIYVEIKRIKNIGEFNSSNHI
ncbi:hypothetical protein ACNF40_02220 [Cuniculiplasma sp. SKW4]|uniref:hypothetical protein n=1 Tax=Cuniculiplasma sp. SKW4 TaxID=3400171 RepID=UPI003FD3EE85